MVEAAAKGVLLTAAATVIRAVAEIDLIVAEIDDARTRLSGSTDDVLLLTGAGGLLHGLYSRIERLFRDIAIGLHGGADAGEAWHARLLDLMATDVPGGRPVELFAGFAPHPGFGRQLRPSSGIWPPASPLIRPSATFSRKREKAIGRKSNPSTSLSPDQGPACGRGCRRRRREMGAAGAKPAGKPEKPARS